MSCGRFCRLYGEHGAVSTGASPGVGYKAARSIEADWYGPGIEHDEEVHRSGSKQGQWTIKYALRAKLCSPPLVQHERVPGVGRDVLTCAIS